MSKHPMTARGAEKLREELNHLKNVVRREIIEAIAEARAHGDLKENAEYHAAKERQSFTEGRINEVENKLSHAQIIDITSMPNDGKVVFGATVSLVNTESDEEVCYQIVGEDEADLKQNRISYSSPVAKAIIAKMEGDIVNINTPSGLVEYEILKVDYIGD
jgi:transcription elongation factor GreA